MGNLIMEILIVSDLIAFDFFAIRYAKKETIKDAIGWLVASAVMGALYLIISINGNCAITNIVTICVFLINCKLAISEIASKKKK